MLFFALQQRIVCYNVVHRDRKKSIFDKKIQLKY